MSATAVSRARRRRRFTAASHSGSGPS
jgi:hypothetical protein